MVSLANSTKHLGKSWYQSFQILPINWKGRGRNTSKFNLRGQHYPHTKARQGHYKKPVSFMNIDAKFPPKKYLKIEFNSSLKESCIRFKWGMQRWFIICKSTNMIHHVNRMKGKNHMITSVDAEKFYKI